MKKPRRPEDILTDAVRVSPIAQAPGVLMMRNNVAKAVRIGSDHPELFGLAEGSADLILCVHGRFVALELKTSKGRMRDKQEAWADQLEGAGGDYLIAQSVDEANRIVGLVREKEGLRQQIVAAARMLVRGVDIGNTSVKGFFLAEIVELARKLKAAE